MSTPQLSIIITTYNSGKYISQAIESVLAQTFGDFELIIINDGSTDNTKEIVSAFSDERIKYFENEKNEGIVFSRNKGLKLAQGSYIGMLDADDIAHPNKFENQIDFLERNPEYGMVGSWAKFIDAEGKHVPGSWKLKAKPQAIPAIMLFKNYFLQSAVLYRRECISGYEFKEGFEIGEDYLIWYEILKEWKAWNLQQYLLDYRVHEKSITQSNIDFKREKEKEIFGIILKGLEIEPSDEELELHLTIREGNTIDNIKTLLSIEKWLLKIIAQNRLLNIYNQKILERIVFERWLKVCSKAGVLHFKMLKHLITSKIFSIFIKSFGSNPD